MSKTVTTRLSDEFVAGIKEIAEKINNSSDDD